MRVLRILLFVAAAALLPTTVHASARSTTQHFTRLPAALEHPHTAHSARRALPAYFPLVHLPTHTTRFSFNPPAPSRAFSFLSLAIHSLLGLFRHTSA